VLGLAIGITLLVVAWGYLVYAAIDFGGSARDGKTRAWVFLALAALGAIACLFAGLMLVARLLQRLATARPGPSAETPPSAERSNKHRA
jgi:TRAP-type C4-dicarboxylate transport system permease small subunit